MLAVGHLKDVTDTLEMRDSQGFNRKRILELPVLSSSFKARTFEIEGSIFAVSCNSLIV
jgi:hypothetical protein